MVEIASQWRDDTVTAADTGAVSTRMLDRVQFSMDRPISHDRV